MGILRTFYLDEPEDFASKLPVDLILWIPILIGAAATLGGVALNASEARKARKRADAQYEILRKNQKRFSDRAEERLQKSIGEFKPGDRESLRQEVILENEQTLGDAIARDRNAIDDTEVGNVSEQFINQKAALGKNLRARADRKVGLRSRVLAPGIANFFEKERLLEAGGKQNTNRLLARGALNVDTNAVQAASIPRGNTFADILSAVGPALLTYGALAPAAPAAAGLAGAGNIPASQLSLLTQGGLVGAGGSTGAAGFSGLDLGLLISSGLLGGAPDSRSGGPRRGFTTLGA